MVLARRRQHFFILLIWIIFERVLSHHPPILSTSRPCKFEKIRDGVCVCNSTYCDTLDLPEPKAGEYYVITSSKGGKRFSIQAGKLQNKADDLDEKVLLTIDPYNTYSKVVGFGGAFTDAVTVNLQKMTPSQQNFFYQSYFDKQYGSGYTIIRIPLGGSDFSVSPWAYNELPEGDYEVTNINELDARDKDRVKFIMDLEYHVNRTDLRYMFCTWSSPKWMKSNNNWTGISHLLPEYYESWAEYHGKALKLFKKAGINVWAVSTGNEPSNCLVMVFMTLCWDPFDQVRWTKNHLKPALIRHGFGDVKVLGVDDQRISIPYYLQAFEANESNRTIVDIDIIGVHWYYDQVFSPEIFDRTDLIYKLPIIYSECVVGATAGSSTEDYIQGPLLGSWPRAVGYISKIIELFTHCISGFVDWNLVLDEQGGPNYVNNFVDSPIIYENGTIFKQPTFYAIAHFSKFLQGDCTRIQSTLDSPDSATVESIAFECTDKNVVILHNYGPKVTHVKIDDIRIGYIQLTLDPNSINTITYINDHY